MNNIEYIRKWFISHNLFLKEEEEQEEKLNILVFYAIAFERIAGLKAEDEIVMQGGTIRCVPGPVIAGEEAERILKVLNVQYAYLSLEALKRTKGYIYMQCSGIEGAVKDEDLRENLADIFVKVMRYYRHYNFDKYVYKVNGNVFFSVNPLTEAEQAELAGIHSRGQTLYEISHTEDGIMSIY